MQVRKYPFPLFASIIWGLLSAVGFYGLSQMQIWLKAAPTAPTLSFEGILYPVLFLGAPALLIISLYILSTHLFHWWDNKNKIQHWLSKGSITLILDGEETTFNATGWFNFSSTILLRGTIITAISNESWGAQYYDYDGDTVLVFGKIEPVRAFKIYETSKTGFMIAIPAEHN
jgi:hypothetical protein